MNHTATSLRLIDGIFLLNKPLGFSSNQALQKAKRLLGAKKAGHTGSLDPLATGLLPLCFGEATKFSSYLLNADKTYEVTAQLGVSTTTGDSEGDIIAKQPTSAITLSDIEAAISKFTGSYEQVPPMYSALKHQGQPLYKLARQGKTIERQARLITIYTLQLLAFHGDTLTLRVACSKGTYIRSLIEDIGQFLGCGGHITALHRTATGCYNIANALSLEQLATRIDQNGIEAVINESLLSVADCLPAWPQICLCEEDLCALRQGKVIAAPSGSIACGPVKLMTKTGVFAGLAELAADHQLVGKRLWHGVYR